MEFSNLSALVGSGGVEVAQAHVAQSVRPIVSFERILEEKFGSPVGIDRLPRRIFGDRNFFWCSIHRARRGENELSHSGVQRGIQQRESRLRIVLEINARV